MSVGLAFLAYFRNFLIPAATTPEATQPVRCIFWVKTGAFCGQEGLFSNSSFSPVTRLNPSSLSLLMSIPMNTSVRISTSWNVGFQQSSILAKRTLGSGSASSPPGAVLRARSRSDSIGNGQHDDLASGRSQGSGCIAIYRAEFHYQLTRCILWSRRQNSRMKSGDT